MADILLKIEGDDAAEVLKYLEKLFKKTFGSDFVFPGLSASGGILNTLATTTLVVAIPVILAQPRGIFQQLKSQNRQDAFIRFLQKLQQNYNVDFTITTPGGEKVNLADMTDEEIRMMFQG